MTPELPAPTELIGMALGVAALDRSLSLSLTEATAGREDEVHTHQDESRVQSAQAKHGKIGPATCMTRMQQVNRRDGAQETLPETSDASYRCFGAV